MGLKILLFCAVAVILVSGCSSPYLEGPGYVRGRVTEIFDGDTLRIGETVVRLALVDTPEHAEDGFLEATERTESICPLGSEAMVDVDAGQPQDSYGRTVGVVYCGNINLNKDLLDSGHAVIVKEFCMISEFGKEEWAQGCAEGAG